MTLLAVEEKHTVRRIDGPKYRVGPRCSNPNCNREAGHAHHIFTPPRMRWDWIAIGGYVTGNMTGLCVYCHDDIHANRAWIRWIDERFVWCLVGPKDRLGKPTPLPVGPLSYQPPTPDTLATDDHDHPQASDTQSGPESCPFCGQERKRRLPRTRVGRRKRKSWTVLVPDEKVEDGADVLDNLIANLAPLVPNADESATGRYYVLVAALAYSQISAVDFVESFRDAA